MKRHKWEPTKFVSWRGSLVASRNPKYVARGSRFFVSLLGGAYCRLLVKYAKGRLIDLGCGSAPLWGTYESLTETQTLADWPHSLHETKLSIIEADLNGLLPFEDEAYDTVLLTDVLEHIAEPWQLLKECSRICAPGGCIIIGVPFMYWLHEEPHDYYRYTRYALQNMLQHAGFELVEQEAIGNAADVVADIFLKHFGIFAWTYYPVAFFVHTLFRPVFCRLWRLSSQKYALAYVLVARKVAHG